LFTHSFLSLSLTLSFIRSQNQDKPRPAGFHFSDWFNDGVDNIIHSPQLTINLHALIEEDEEAANLMNGGDNGADGADRGGKQSGDPSSFESSSSALDEQMPTPQPLALHLADDLDSQALEAATPRLPILNMMALSVGDDSAYDSQGASAGAGAGGVDSPPISARATLASLRSPINKSLDLP
jgi:hypothetical protein